MKKGVLFGIILAVALAAAFAYRFTHLTTGGKEAAEAKGAGEQKGEGKAAKAAPLVKMSAAVQAENGVVVGVASKKSLGDVISATGKVEVNDDRIAHVSPRLAGKLVSVGASLGDSVSAGQVIARLDSVELAEALNKYRQSQARLALMKNNIERVKSLVEKKIAARKEIYQAETEYQSAAAEVHSDEERLLIYGLSRSELASAQQRRALVPVRSPISGVITEKHAIIGELADPSRSLYTVADLSTVWVMVDINEKDLSRVRKGQGATVSVGAFPEKFRGRIDYISDVVDEATRAVKARVAVPNPGRRLKPEMFATVEIALPATGPAVLAIPGEAVQEVDGKKVVFVTANGTDFLPREVRHGAAAGGMVPVVGGLAEGERLAVKGSFLLKSELKKGELGEE